MKKRSFVAGMLTMLLIMTLVVPAAATVGKITKELEYRDISVTLDGVKLDLKDAKGNPVEPFMFEGTNYLPVRALAESLGLNVAWDGKTATVVLTTPSAPTSPNAGVVGTPATMGQQNALKSAQQYLKISAFSYTGLIKQLEYEKYSAADAKWAADNCGADWFAEAVESAAKYLRVSSFSRQSLIDQLLYEGFTQEQAVHGVTQNGY